MRPRRMIPGRAAGPDPSRHRGPAASRNVFSGHRVAATADRKRADCPRRRSPDAPDSQDASSDATAITAPRRTCDRLRRRAGRAHRRGWSRSRAQRSADQTSAAALRARQIGRTIGFSPGFPRPPTAPAPVGRRCRAPVGWWERSFPKDILESWLNGVFFHWDSDAAGKVEGPDEAMHAFFLIASVLARRPRTCWSWASGREPSSTSLPCTPADVAASLRRLKARPGARAGRRCHPAAAQAGRCAPSARRA